jgi:hypothetical protein
VLRMEVGSWKVARWKGSDSVRIGRVSRYYYCEKQSSIGLARSDTPARSDKVPLFSKSDDCVKTTQGVCV